MFNPSSLFIKICGITTPAGAAVCAEAGASAIGINFYPKSKRFIALSDARTWLPSVAGPGSPARVALFVNAGFDEIRAAAESALFEAIQLHGYESPDFCAAVQNLGLPVIRGLALRGPESLDLLQNHPADAFILDAFAPGEFGGTSHLSDWPLATAAIRRFPEKTLLLSGGLTPENVSRAIHEVHPSGVDVASGVESSPGIKDPAKIRAFIAAARSAFPSLASTP